MDTDISLGFGPKEAAVLEKLFDQLAETFNPNDRESLLINFDKQYFDYKDEVVKYSLNYCHNSSCYYIFKQMSYINSLVVNIDKIKAIDKKFISKEFFYKSLGEIVTLIGQRKHIIDEIEKLNNKWILFNKSKKRIKLRQKTIKDIEEEICKYIHLNEMYSCKINELAYHYESMEIFQLIE